MATFTWSITYMNCLPQEEGQTDVVIEAGWFCLGTQTTNGTAYKVNAAGNCAFTYTGGAFTPYSQLTQDQVLGWCWSSGVDKAQTEATLQSNIDTLINPPVYVVPVQLPLPWTA